MDEVRTSMQKEQLAATLIYAYLKKEFGESSNKVTKNSNAMDMEPAAFKKTAARESPNH